MKLIAEWLVRAFVLLVTTYIVPGFRIESLATALIVAAVLAILNLLLKPILVLFTLPATILSLGLFMFVINAVLLVVASYLVQDFKIDSFLTAIIASVAITLISSLLNMVLK